MYFLPSDNDYLYSLSDYLFYDEEDILNLIDHDPHRNNEDFLMVAP